MGNSCKLGELYHESNEIKICSVLKSLQRFRIHCAIEIKDFLMEKLIKEIN